MNWQQIMESVLEINELQQKIIVKSQSEIIKEIINRKQKYFDHGPVDINSLNNAILEHKIKLTPYQITILEQINSLALTTDIQVIYTNMPTSQEEAEKYVTELKKKYELVLNCFDLIIDIEKISETEYTFNYPFENSIYANKVKLEIELFIKYFLDNHCLNREILEKSIVNKQTEFMNSLSIEEKKQLLIESLVLSYDRNAFDYFSGLKKIIEECSKRNIKSSTTIYNFYKNLLLNLENHSLSQMSLQQIYDELGTIYETELYKQRIMQK